MDGENKMKARLNNFLLAIITVISGLLISGFYYFLSPQIEKTRQEKQNQIMQQFFPEGANFISVNPALTVVKDREDREIGFVCKTEDNGGYGGRVNFIVALDKEWKIKDFLMTEHAETPGLGTLVNEPGFRKAFQGIMPTLENLPADKKDFQKKLGIDAISGATYSSMAAVRGMADVFQKAGDYHKVWQFDRVWNAVSGAYAAYAEKFPAPVYRRRAIQQQQPEGGIQ